MGTHVWLLALILIALFFLIIARRDRRRVRQGRLLSVHRRCRHWWPRTPDDCVHCWQGGDRPEAAPPPPGVRPWREGKSRRGAPRRIATDGYACRMLGCPYAGITDSQVHALVADGHHGRTDHIQDFVCQACGGRVSARWGTALFQLKTPPARIGEVLSARPKGSASVQRCGSSGMGKRPSPAGVTALPSRPPASTPTFCTIFTCSMCSLMRSGRACAHASGSSGSGWPSTPRPS